MVLSSNSFSFYTVIRGEYCIMIANSKFRGGIESPKESGVYISSFFRKLSLSLLLVDQINFL
jgi:hypothetical protein